MKIVQSLMFVILALAATACMTEADRMIFQEVFHSKKADSQLAANPEEIKVKPSPEPETTKAADASELQENTPESSL